MVLTGRCVLRNLGDPSLCEPTNAAYLALHGSSGTGGRIGEARIPTDFIGLLLEDLTELAAEQPKLHEEMGFYAKSFRKQYADVRDEIIEGGGEYNDARIKSIYLWSESPGTGKTAIACALLHEYILQSFLGHVKRKQAPPLRPVYFLDVNEWQTEYNAFNRPMVNEDQAKESSARYYRAFEKAKNAELLVMDDIGVRDSTDGFRGDLHTIINHRVARGLPTIYTSNIPMSRLPEVFGEQRLADRVRDMTKEIHVSGTTRRGFRR